MLASNDWPVPGWVHDVARAIQNAGGRPVLVGGAVRDLLLRREINDYDIEVFGLNAEELVAGLSHFGDVHVVGRAFGVMKLDLNVDGRTETIDVSLPRRETKSGRGHTGFSVEPDPSLSFDEASARRDFTVNAMGVDLVSGELLDPHNGAHDLEKRVLRKVSDAFAEDPLRVFRAAQFSARLLFRVDDETIWACRSLHRELRTLPPERIFHEWRKILLAPCPSVGIAVLAETGALSLTAELVSLIGCPQDEEWHPEGDVFQHTLMVVDEAAKLATRAHLDDDERLIVVAAALCHDFGKALSTERISGRWRSVSHDTLGEKPTRAFFERIGAPTSLTSAVVPLVREHLRPFQLFRERESVSDGAIRRLAIRVDIKQLCLVAAADHFGRTTKEAIGRDSAATDWLLDAAARVHALGGKPAALVRGQDVLNLGLAPGPAIKKILDDVFDAQLDGRFSTREAALHFLKNLVDTRANQ